jgi:hypothetical protein
VLDKDPLTIKDRVSQNLSILASLSPFTSNLDLRYDGILQKNVLTAKQILIHI